jgi:hypothetical protein
MNTYYGKQEQCMGTDVMIRKYSDKIRAELGTDVLNIYNDK